MEKQIPDPLTTFKTNPSFIFDLEFTEKQKQELHEFGSKNNYNLLYKKKDEKTALNLYAMLYLLKSSQKQINNDSIDFINKHLESKK